MRIPLNEKESLIAVIDSGLNEYRDIRSLQLQKGHVTTQIETCRGAFRMVIVCGNTIFYTGRAETEEAVRALADTYRNQLFIPANKVLAFPTHSLHESAVRT